MKRLRQRGRLSAPGKNYPYTVACSTEVFPPQSSDAVPDCPVPCAPSTTRALESEIVRSDSLCLWWVTVSPANTTNTRLLLSSFKDPFFGQPWFLHKWHVVLFWANMPRCTIFGKLCGQYFTLGKTYCETLVHVFLSQWTKERGKRRQRIINSLLLPTILTIRVSHFWIGKKQYIALYKRYEASFSLGLKPADGCARF